MKRLFLFLIAVCLSANVFSQITKQQADIKNENNPVQNLNSVQNYLDNMILTWENLSSGMYFLIVKDLDENVNVEKVMLNH